MIRDINEIQSLATKYSKQQLAHMAQIGLIDPTKAVMAGMMIDRITKSNIQPPQTTVADEALSPMQPPPAMQPAAPAGIGALPAQQEPNTGVAALPSNIPEMAAGGIVAFDDGGDVTDPDWEKRHLFPRALSAWGDIVTYPARGAASVWQSGINTARDFGVPLPDVFGGVPQEFLTEVNPFTQRLRQQRINELKDYQRRGSQEFPVESKSPSTAEPFVPPAVEKKQKSGIASIPEKAAGVAKSPVVEKAAGVAGLPSVAKATVTPYKMPEQETIKQVLDRQAEADKEAGVDNSIYEKLRQEYEGKRGKVNERKQEAIGNALMQTGIAMLGARRGQEFATLSSSGQQALAGLVTANEKLRDYEEKIDDKQRELVLAENEYKRTKSKSALQRVESIEAKRNELENKTVDAQNKAAEHRETIDAQIRGQDITARGQDLQYKASMAHIGQLARPGETERLMAQYQSLYAKDPAAAGKWLENLGMVRGIGKPQNTFSFEEAMKIVANKPTNINASPDELARQARELIAAQNVQVAQPSAVAPGTVVQGYKFKGGDPNKKENWEKV